MVDKSLEEKIKQAVFDGDQNTIADLIQQAVDAGNGPLMLINEVLNPALKLVGDQFDRGDMFLPELIMAAEAMEAAVKVLKPHLESANEELQTPGIVVIATVQGDIHDIGKNIVTALLRANGFEVHDLGRDVSAVDVIAKAEELSADIIGLSALLTTTLPYCADTVKLLKERGIREKYHVYIGGGAATPEYAEKIEAIYGGAHAEAAVTSMLKIMGKE